ncbi:MAG: Hsp20/alpha crystallin family protein [Phycisphaerae bacterium]
MNLIPWRNKQKETAADKPANEIRRFRSEMDRLFDRFIRDPWHLDWPWPAWREDDWGPRIDLAESDREVIVRAELPGIEPKDVELKVAGNMLTIRGEKTVEREEKARDYHYSERQYGSFHRCIQLPGSVDPDNVDATYKNGVLTVTLAKRPEALSKRIEVHTN